MYMCGKTYRAVIILWLLCVIHEWNCENDVSTRERAPVCRNRKAEIGFVRSACFWFDHREPAGISFCLGLIAMPLSVEEDIVDMVNAEQCVGRCCKLHCNLS